MSILVVAAVLVAGCYNPPSPMAVQAQRDAAWRDYYNRQEYARQQAEAAKEAEENAATERACAGTDDVNAKIACAQWRLARQNLEFARQRQAFDRQRAADEAAYQQAQAAKDAKEERRQRIGDAIKAGADAYQRAQPRNCTSTLIGNQISTTCF
jgi:hypothetical protein